MICIEFGFVVFGLRGLLFRGDAGIMKEHETSCGQEAITMTPEQMEERDVVEFVDDEGNTLLLEVMDYFFYNGEEFAALCDAKDEDDESEDDGVYIMKINTYTDENGEEMEEFVPPEEALMDKLIAIVQTRFDGADDEDEE